MSVHAAPLNDEARWEQVLARNEAHDESFVYAVASTGIYCRPTCAGRHPRRSVVEFHSCAADAESAGFRACKRCRPSGVSPLRERMERVHRACATLQRAPETSIARLAAEGGVSTRRMQREFKAMLGLSPRQYSAACRLSRFKQLVAGGENVTDAVYGAGYGSSSRLYERAGALGMTPGAYRRGAVGKTVGVTVVETDFGLILVAATAAGICAVRFGEPGTQFGTPEELIDGLRREFPEAELVSDDETLQPWAEMVARHVSGHSRVLELPLDIRGTVFQVQGGDALQRIPRGQTRTYGAIAAEIGRPEARRAVGSACRANPVPLAIPCHRVVPASGGWGNWAPGAEKKRELLDRERTPPPED